MNPPPIPSAGVTCPHCGAANPPGGAFCEACGKALPAPSGGPRLVTGSALPSTAAGQQLVGDELAKQTKKAANTLLIVGIIQLVCALAVVGLLMQNAPAGSGEAKILAVVQVMVAALFFGLYFWARKSPLPASIVGLCLYATLVVANVVATLTTIGDREARRGIGGAGIGWLDIVIMVVLAQGIQAGLKHKRLKAGQPA